MGWGGRGVCMKLEMDVLDELLRILKRQYSPVGHGIGTRVRPVSHTGPSAMPSSRRPFYF